MKLLISGTTGFVGRNLVRYLYSTEKELYCLGLNTRHDGGVSESILWHNLNSLGCYKCNTVIHLAGKAHDIIGASDPLEYFKVNTGLTKKLFDLFIDSDARDFIYFSSVKAVADTVLGVLNEDVAANPKTSYGESKYKAEQYLLSKELPEGKRIFILRPCMIHGPGNKGNLNLLYNVVKKGIPYPLAAFENRRSFLSINNLLFVIEQLLNNPAIPGGIYNIADDEPLATSEVIKIMGEANGSKPRLWSLSPTLIQTFVRVGDKLRLPLNSERLKKLTESYVVSNHKLKNALGIKALPVSSRDGLLETIRSFEK
ncbi:nucleoside-diphosphate-sugar epimerase [Anseongella ginsenosidimutans]|uniref:Nucleoside-diphosphate-sugar epimerase n=1 Tax=Anseongella ginsenosidimutans TaxID=496056 RepID=A0A4R3KM53_9SPHI|nr:NAD-dependent epimerase/dehydratase family protein [Anseongella ginsenosidimutans]QEC52146.1 NAD-dependent epimerase/dehydratase family protein [Anseongella ginsenosidimutans]TCS84825.1 nucleoside-diphosphate-sugar epimerase [Anseongella ginsenosidimutans]